MVATGSVYADTCPASKPTDYTGPCWYASSPFLRATQPDSRFEPAIQVQPWNTAALAKLAAFTNSKTNGTQPNILIIYVDDMGWGDPGVYGGGWALGAPTPEIDKLAASGLRMTSAYSQPACTPTRAAWQTGRLPQRSGLTRPTAAGEPEMGMNQELTIAEILQTQGYRTGMAGKWHLGEGDGMWPTDVGYDTYYGNLGVNTAYHDWRDKNFSPELVFDTERKAAMDNLGFIKTTVKVGLDGNTADTSGEVIDLDCSDDFCEQLLEEKYLEFTKAFITDAVSDADQLNDTTAPVPFFFYHAMNRVHTKNYPSEEFEGASPASTPYRDGIMEVDSIVGELMAHLDTLGIRNDTFVFFTSDNGAEEDVHAGGINTSDAGHQPWRGAKGTTWEGGVRVSAIASWPGTSTDMIQAGRVSDGLFDHMDLFNTLAHLGGIPDLATWPGANGVTVPTDRYVDGIDQTTWLLANQTAFKSATKDTEDPGQTSNRETINYWYGQQFYGVRWAEYKRMERIMNIGMSVGPQTYGGLFNATMSETSDPTMGWFFNLYSDPKERMPITRTWNIATLNELSGRTKTTFINYPGAPRGVVIDGHLIDDIDGKRGGKLLKKVRQTLARNRIHAAGLPD